MGEENDAKSGSTGTRRTFLQTVGAASAVAGIGGLAGAQETTDEGDETTTADGEETSEDDATLVVLGGRASYWYGLEPAAIEGEENPTLSLREGERYRLVWVNLDGEEHEWHVEDEDGDVLERTEAASSAGEVRELTFEASESMATYRCEYHPERMAGEVEIGDGFETTTADETTDEGETTAAGGTTVDVAVGPEGQYLRFVPGEVEISVGDTVRWTAESEGHNVSAKPEAATQVELPEGAEPFATYEGNRSFLVMQVGDTFEHTFTVPGTYVYVCVPHASEGMVGTVVVSE